MPTLIPDQSITLGHGRGNKQRLGHITPEKIRKFQPTLVYWGAGAAGAVGLFLSSVPIFKVRTT